MKHTNGYIVISTCFDCGLAKLVGCTAFVQQLLNNSMRNHIVKPIRT